MLHNPFLLKNFTPISSNENSSLVQQMKDLPVKMLLAEGILLQ